MHLIDEVDLKTTATWRILHVVEKLSRVFDLGSRRRIHFDKVYETALIDLHARVAFFTGYGAYALFAI